MRSKEFFNDIMQANSFHFCLEFIFQNKSKLFLTSCQREINILGNLYKPNSGIEVKQCEQNDSGQNSLILEGFIEDGGIDDVSLLDSSEVVITIYLSNNKHYKWIKYYLNSYKISGMKFELEYVSYAHKLCNFITKNYSSSCRATFGDDECGVDKRLHPGAYCDKTISMCCNKYKNAINFRGEPFIPTLGYYSSLDE